MDEHTLLLSREAATLHETPWINQPIQLVYPIAIVLLLSFATGILDGVTVPLLHIYVGMDTGNYIYLSLSLAGLQPQYPAMIKPVRCCVQLGSAWCGNLTAGLFSNAFGPKRRWVILLETYSQTFIFFLVAILIYAKVLNYDDEKECLIIISILAFALGMQQVSIKVFDMPYINCAFVTVAVAELLSDPNLFAPWNKNDKRNHRVAFVIVLFLGGMVGGLCLKKAGSPELGIVLAGCLKMAIGFYFCMLKQSNFAADYSKWNVVK